MLLTVRVRTATSSMGKQLHFSTFLNMDSFGFFSDTGEILLETNANQADSDTNYLL